MWGGWRRALVREVVMVSLLGDSCWCGAEEAINSRGFGEGTTDGADSRGAMVLFYGVSQSEERIAAGSVELLQVLDS